MSSSTVNASIKWGKQVVEVALSPSGGVASLKQELQLKTGVPVARQKIMAKTKGLWKGVLKDDTDFATVQFPETIQLLLMGSAEVVKGPTVKTVFLEDLPAEQRAVMAEPAGLVNLGNTCYLNSVVQCLRAVPELQTSLHNGGTHSTAASNNNNAAHAMFARALHTTYQQLNRQEEALQPMALVSSVKMAFPQFAQLSPSGQPMQQDAEEFYSGLLAILAQQGTDVDTTFAMKLQETLTCDEFATTAETAGAKEDDAAPPEVEPPVISHDLHRKLVCAITGGEVNHVAEGIVLGLTGKIEKNSSILGRDAVWTRQQRIAKLPQVLTVQFGRFYWKVTPDSQDHAGVKCKVMKPVAFSDTLDVYDFCTDEIQAVLLQARRAKAALEEAKVNRKLEGKDEENDTNGDAEMKDAAAPDEEEDEDLSAALAMSMQPAEEKALESLGPGFPKTFTGQYELFAVVTHKGRDADGGHYMAWVKSDHQSTSNAKIADTDVTNEDWFVFDDDEVSPCKTEDVLKLKGGGDWHMSYLNFYRVKK